MAEFQAMTIIELGNMEMPFTYPITDPEGNIIEEVWDHGLRQLPAELKMLNFFKRTVHDKSDRVLFNVGNIKPSLFVTDSRVILFCQDYDKGDSQYSGNGSLILNALEHRKGKKRAAGKAFAGHIRYEWLLHVGYKKKVSFGTDEQILLIYQDNDQTTYKLELIFTKTTDAEALAHDILRRACNYRLTMTDTDSQNEKAVEAFKKYANGGRIDPSDDPKTKYSIVRLPYCYLAPGGKTFRPGTQKQESE